MDDVAECMIVLSDVSERARMGDRRGRKLPGELVAGPIEDELASCDWVTSMDGRSGDGFREEAAELPELSGSSVKPNNLGRRPRCCAILSESVVISSARRGGDRTSGKTCNGKAIELAAVLVPTRGLPAGLTAGDVRGEASREVEVERLIVSVTERDDEPGRGSL